MEAFAVVNNALNDLLNGAPAMYNREKGRKFNPIAPVYAGMKFVHWYDEKINPTDDKLAEVFNTQDEPEEDNMFDAIAGDDTYDDSEEEHNEESFARLNMDAREHADKMIESLQSGEQVSRLPKEYHILLISGANGRAMVRHYEQGNYETLQKNHRKRNQDT